MLGCVKAGVEMKTVLGRAEDGGRRAEDQKPFTGHQSTEFRSNSLKKADADSLSLAVNHLETDISVE